MATASATSQAPLANHEDGGSGRSPELGALLAVNRIRLYEKYHRRPSTSLFRATVVLHYLLRQLIQISEWP